MTKGEVKGTIFKIQRYSVQDGPGIRATVFLNGCPLECQWCSNPESQSGFPHLMFVKRLCTRCGLCVGRCPVGAISLNAEHIEIDRDKCKMNGECVKACYFGALEIVGRQMSVMDVFEEIKKDRLFFQNSGGGVTLSGGEPLIQPKFVTSFLQKCNSAGIHTCIDTCGFVAPHILKGVLEYTDLFLYDLKMMDTTMHQRYTGMPNQRILDNAILIANSKVPMVIRIPLIPGINDSEKNIRSIAHFVRNSLKSVNQIDLLPYHRLGVNKYEMLDRPYLLTGLSSCEKKDVERTRKIIVDEFNFGCQIGG